jgi:hypothetical protein
VRVNHEALEILFKADEMKQLNVADLTALLTITADTLAGFGVGLSEKARW